MKTAVNATKRCKVTLGTNPLVTRTDVPSPALYGHLPSGAGQRS